MAKTAKLKKTTPSAHSRASKRAPPPSLPGPSTGTPSTSISHRPSHPHSPHHHHTGGGVTKKSRTQTKRGTAGKGGKALLRRRERGVTVREIRERKVEKKGRGERERGVAWDELNKRILTGVGMGRKGRKGKGKREGDAEGEGDMVEGEGEDGDGVGEEAKVRNSAGDAGEDERMPEEDVIL